MREEGPGLLRGPQRRPWSMGLSTDQHVMGVGTIRGLKKKFYWKLVNKTTNSQSSHKVASGSYSYQLTQKGTEGWVEFLELSMALHY